MLKFIMSLYKFVLYVIKRNYIVVKYYELSAQIYWIEDICDLCYILFRILHVDDFDFNSTFHLCNTVKIVLVIKSKFKHMV